MKENFEQKKTELVIQNYQIQTRLAFPPDPKMGDQMITNPFRQEPETQKMFCSKDQAISMQEKPAELFCPIHHCSAQELMLTP
jgi:hypothetical protein